MASPVISLELDQDQVIAYPYAAAAVVASVTATFSGGGTLLNYVYDWGDGSSQTLISPTQLHEYTLAGTYTVLVTVTDSNGLTASASKQVRVYRESIVPPETPSEVPPRQQHVPLNPRQPGYMTRRPSGSTL